VRFIVGVLPWKALLLERGILAVCRRRSKRKPGCPIVAIRVGEDGW
jgi:hypothetical protein